MQSKLGVALGKRLAAASTRERQRRRAPSRRHSVHGGGSLTTAAGSSTVDATGGVSGAATAAVDNDDKWSTVSAPATGSGGIVVGALGSSSVAATAGYQEEDALGDCLAEALNRHPAFCGSRGSEEEAYSAQKNAVRSFQLSPLVSRHNLAVLRELLANCMSLTRRRKDVISDDNNSNENRSRLISIGVLRAIFDDVRPVRYTVKFLLQIILILIPFAAIASHVLIVQSCRAAALLAWYLFVALFDVEELKRACYPETIRNFVGKLHVVAIWIDDHVLQGRRFAGREWNRDRFCFDDDQPNSSSRMLFSLTTRSGSVSSSASSSGETAPPPESIDKTLLELPPPSVQRNGRRLSLSPHHLLLSEEQWSRQTVQHMVAINFCYVMEREEKLRGQASQRRKLLLRKEKNAKRAAYKPTRQGTRKPSNKGSELIGMVHLGGSDETNISDSEKSGRPQSAMANMMPNSIEEDEKNLIHLSDFDEAPRLHQRERTGSSVAVLLEDPGLFPLKEDGAHSSGHPATPVEAFELKTMSAGGGAVGRIGDDDEDGDYYDVFRNSVPGSPTFPHSPILSEASQCSNASDVAGDLPWIDVGAKIGMRLLNSAHVQRAMASQEAADQLMMGISGGALGDVSAGCTNTSAEALGEASRIVVPASCMDNEKMVTVSSPGLDSRRSQAPSPAGLGRPSLPRKPSRFPKPVHSMWTSPAAAAPSPSHSIKSENDESSPSLGNNQSRKKISRPGLLPSPGDNRRKPPLSPRGTDVDAPSSQNSSPFYVTITHSSAAMLSNDDKLAPPALNRLGLPESIVGPASASPGGRRILRPADRRALSRHSTRSKDSDISAMAGERLNPLLPGVKIAVPIFPIQPRNRGLPKRVTCRSQFQMGTVVKSVRIYAGSGKENVKRKKGDTNCLSVTVKLDKTFLRNAEFAELTFRVMDDWGSRYMPRHSKVPIGSCVATTYGLGVVVGWRVEDDCHVVRSLWQRRGSGVAHAYLNRDAIHSTVEAAVGFDVHSKYGWGVVLAYVDGGRTFESGRYFVAIKEDGRHHGHVLELNRKDILSCYGAQFIPVIEHIREGAHYQIQVDNYDAAIREQEYDDSLEKDVEKLFDSWSPLLQIIWSSFLKVIEEDKAFDEGVNEFMTSIIEFLERLDGGETEETKQREPDEFVAGDFEVECIAGGIDPVYTDGPEEPQEPGFWIVNDFFGGIFRPGRSEDDSPTKQQCDPVTGSATNDAGRKVGRKKPTYYDRVFAVLKTLMKTVSIAKAESVEYPQFRMALALSYDFLLFVRTIVKVQQKNVSAQSLEVWKRALEEIALTFGPLKERLQKIGQGIAQRMEKQGRKAKIRVLKFVDAVLGDEKLLFAMEQGEWDQCLSRIESALIKSNIIQEESLFYYRKTGQFIYDHIRSSFASGGGAAARNNEKLALFAQFLQSAASPRRSILKLFRRDDILELIERILVRVYCREEQASRILSIHASNFHSFRQLRMLKDFSVAGKIWIPLLDAADEEFSWVVSHMPENSKEFVSPLSSLFSLCVAQFHKINDGDLSRDWLDFLLEDDAARIIQKIDMKLILALSSFSRDVREMMVVLPYYPR